MSIKIIEQKLQSYVIKTEADEIQAIREISQQIILASLGRTDFFKYAAFQGGTCLRIFYALNRFSEDLDFTLLKPDKHFEWQKYLNQIIQVTTSFGYEAELVIKKRPNSPVKFAFFKDEALSKVLNLRFTGKTNLPKIKLRIDTNPPSHGETEIKYIDFPFLAPVNIHTSSTLFAGKLHALLCRSFVKGRNWYDFMWYTTNKTTINYPYLEQALNQMGKWSNQNIKINPTWLYENLYERIKTIDWEKAISDVWRFVPIEDQPSVKLWNQEIFLRQLDKIFK